MYVESLWSKKGRKAEIRDKAVRMRSDERVHDSVTNQYFRSRVSLVRRPYSNLKRKVVSSAAPILADTHFGAGIILSSSTSQREFCVRSNN